MLTTQITTASAAVHAAGHPAMVPAGSTTSLVVSAPQQPAAPQQAPVAESAALIITLFLGFMLYMALKSKKAKPSYTIMAFTMGVLLSGSMLGVMANQVAGSLGSGLSTMFSTVTNEGGGGTGGTNSP